MSNLILVLSGLLLLGLLLRAGYLALRLRADRAAVPADNRPHEPRIQIGRVRLGFVSLLLIGLLAGAWSAGWFDKALHNIGLNARDCATNAFGATFCGDDLDAYRRQFSPYYRPEESVADTYDECWDEEVGYGATFAQARDMCAYLR